VTVIRQEDPAGVRYELHENFLPSLSRLMGASPGSPNDEIVARHADFLLDNGDPEVLFFNIPATRVAISVIPSAVELPTLQDFMQVAGSIIHSVGAVGILSSVDSSAVATRGLVPIIDRLSIGAWVKLAWDGSACEVIPTLVCADAWLFVSDKRLRLEITAANALLKLEEFKSNIRRREPEIKRAIMNAMETGADAEEVERLEAMAVKMTGIAGVDEVQAASMENRVQVALALAGILPISKATVRFREWLGRWLAMPCPKA
jgi:hypothetical protein